MAKIGKMDKLRKTVEAKERPVEEIIKGNRVALSAIINTDQAQYEYLTLDQITFNPNNDYSGTDKEEDIIDLANDIKRSGLLHNIVVSYRKDGTRMLLSGERRVRAYMHLREQEPDEKKWKTIYAEVMKELEPIDELLIMDAANLQQRGIACEAAQYRKAINRYVENLKEKYKISDTEAMRFAERSINASLRTIQRSVQVERKLNPFLAEMADNGLINQTTALVFASRKANEQQYIADTISRLRDEGREEEIKQFIEDALTAIKEKRLVMRVRPAGDNAFAVAAPEDKREEKRRQRILKECSRMTAAIDKVYAAKKHILSLDSNSGNIDEKILPQLKQMQRLIDTLVEELEEANA